MKSALVTAFLVLCLTGSAVADWPYNDNNIGMYFDEGATNYCCGTLGPLLDAYLILTHATSATVGGWEITITSSGGGSIIGVFPRYDHVSAGTRLNEYVIGLGSPQPTVGGKLVLADVLFVINDAMTPTYGYVGSTYFHSPPDALPAYIDGEDPSMIIPMYPILGGFDDPVIMINNGCVVDTESSSFGTVKSLFR